MTSTLLAKKLEVAIVKGTVNEPYCVFESDKPWCRYGSEQDANLYVYRILGELLNSLRHAFLAQLHEDSIKEPQDYSVPVGLVETIVKALRSGADPNLPVYMTVAGKGPSCYHFVFLLYTLHTSSGYLPADLKAVVKELQKHEVTVRRSHIEQLCADDMQVSREAVQKARWLDNQANQAVLRVAEVSNGI